VLTQLAWLLVGGVPTSTTRALLMGAGWGINLAVAEWLIRKSVASPASVVAACRGGRMTS
jgi:hypothetical protein